MPMKFFNPLTWYPPERVHTKFDFTEQDKTKLNPNDKLCGYEFFDEDTLDGILVSRTLLETNNKTRKGEDGNYSIFNRYGRYRTIVDYARTKNTNLISFADPGTWSYVNSFVLPDYLYDTDDLIDYYNMLQYDLAGSVDWPIVDKICQVTKGSRVFIDLTQEVKETRRNLTIELAEDFFKKCNKHTNLQFVPFGTAQGYTPATYRDSIRRIIRLGYQYIAVGGLPPMSEKGVIELLPMIYEEVQKSDHPEVGIHLYGRYPGPKYIPIYLKYGVTSFDNNSPHIYTARASCSYLSPVFKTAGSSPQNPCLGIKIPPANGPMLMRIRRNSPETYNEVKDLCEATFKLFVKYSETKSKSVMKTFLNSFEIMNERLNDQRVRPRSQKALTRDLDQCEQTLELNLWEDCMCTACRMAEDHIFLGRGPRIPYIFLHNSYIMYYRFKFELEKAKKLVSYPDYDWDKIYNFSRLKKNRRRINES
jgi:hypothetical protein